MTENPQQIVDVDSRKRVSLGALATRKRYLAEGLPDGAIKLSPAVVLTQAQLDAITPETVSAVVEANLLPSARPQQITVTLDAEALTVLRLAVEDRIITAAGNDAWTWQQAPLDRAATAIDAARAQAGAR